MQRQYRGIPFTEADFENDLHRAHMKHRGNIRKYRRLQRRVDAAGEEARRKSQEQWAALTQDTDTEFDRILAGNTEQPVPEGKGRHRAERVHFGWFYRLHAWMWTGNVG